MDEVRRADIIPKRTAIEEARDARIAEMVEGDFEQDGPIEGDLEDGDMGQNEENSERISRLELLFDEFREKFSAFMGALKGDDGQGGLLPEIKVDLEELKVGQRHADEKLSSMATQAIRDKAEAEKTAANLKTQIDNVANIARGADARSNQAKTMLEAHVLKEEEDAERRAKEIKSAQRFRWEIVPVYLALAISLFAAFRGGG